MPDPVVKEGGDGAAEIARPDWLPETHWNAEAKAPNLEALQKDYAELPALRTFKTDQEAKLAAIPKTAAEYKLDLPDGVTIPKELGEGFNQDDPDLKGFKALAHEEGLSQKAVSRLLGLWVSLNAKGLAAEQEAHAAALAGLGDNGKGRIAAAKTWIGANKKLAPLADVLTSKEGVEAIEALIGSGIHLSGLPGGDSDKVDTSAMTPRQKLDYANTLAARAAKH